MPHPNKGGAAVGAIKQYDMIPAHNTRVPVGTLAVAIVDERPYLLMKAKGDWIDVATGEAVHGEGTVDPPPGE